MSGLDKVLSATIASLEAENAYLRERHAEAVAQLPATIEVLEKGFAINAFDLESQTNWLLLDVKPHLEHLKTLAKEAGV